MKKLLLLFGFIFFLSNAEAQELAYTETSTNLSKSTLVEFTIESWGTRDSLPWRGVMNIIPLEGSWKAKASFTTESKLPNLSKGSKGVGELSVIRNKTGRLKITKLQGRKLSRAQTVNLTFWGRPPSLK
jgi:hypothetical protein